MGWPVLVVLHNLLSSLYALQSRRLALRYADAYLQISAIGFGFTYIAFLGYAAFHWDQVSFDATGTYLPIYALAGVCIAVANALGLVMYRFVGAATGVIFSVLNLIAIVIVASLVIGETLTPLQLIGSGILIAAICIVFASHQNTKEHRHKWFIGLGISLIMSVLFGVGITAEKYLLDRVGMPTYSVVGLAAEVVPVLIMALVYKPQHFTFLKQPGFLKNVTLLGIARAGAGLFFVLALVAADNASLVGALGGLKIIFTALLAALFLQERHLLRRKLAAAICAFIGVGIMLWP